MLSRKKVVPRRKIRGSVLWRETITVGNMASINFKDDWIVNSGYSQRLTDDSSKFLFQNYCGNDVIIITNDTIHLVDKHRRSQGGPGVRAPYSQLKKI